MLDDPSVVVFARAADHSVCALLLTQPPEELPDDTPEELDPYHEYNSRANGSFQYQQQQQQCTVSPLVGEELELGTHPDVVRCIAGIRLSDCS